MSLAPAAYLLFQKLMRHDPTDATWLGRDRFILSPGHSSLTLYIQLYLAGYGLKMIDLEELRTWGSLTPGHPEYGHTAGPSYRLQCVRGCTTPPRIPTASFGLVPAMVAANCWPPSNRPGVTRPTRWLPSTLRARS